MPALPGAKTDTSATRSKTRGALLTGLRNGNLEKAVAKMESDTGEVEELAAVTAKKPMPPLPGGGGKKKSMPPLPGDKPDTNGGDSTAADVPVSVTAEKSM